MDTGIYCRILENAACTLPVGGLGEVPFRAGWHVYVGSALGPGGLSRVRRHLRLAARRDAPPRWHIDRLLLSPRFRVRYAVCAPTALRLECRLAAALGSGGVAGFGASDCSCRSHLFYRSADPLPEAERAFRNLGLSCTSKRIKESAGQG